MQKILLTLYIIIQTMCCCAESHKDINVIILGDSNTYIGGEDCDQPKGWNKWFCEAFSPASCKSYARSGATWCNTSKTVYNTKENIGKLGDNNVIYNQINRLKEQFKSGKQVAPQLIIIMAGTNDAWFASARPAAMSVTTKQAFAYQDGYITSKPANKILSLAESVRYGCEMLMQAFPKSQIVLITPMQSVSAGESGITAVGNIIESCAQHMSINVIRLDYGGGIYRVTEKATKTNTYDGNHTSENGAKKCGRYIARRIESLLQM